MTRLLLKKLAFPTLACCMLLGALALTPRSAEAAGGCNNKFCEGFIITACATLQFWNCEGGVFCDRDDDTFCGRT